MLTRKSNPVLCEHLSDNVTLHFKDQRAQLRSVTEIAAPVGMIFVAVKKLSYIA